MVGIIQRQCQWLENEISTGEVEMRHIYFSKDECHKLQWITKG